jgi:hypothetical protein
MCEGVVSIGVSDECVGVRCEWGELVSELRGKIQVRISPPHGSLGLRGL